MNLIDMLENLWQFFFEAAVSYAKTDEGARHLQKVADDLGLTPEEIASVDGVVATAVKAANANLPNFDFSGSKKGSGK